MSTTEAFESMNKISGDNFAAMSKLWELNADLWIKLANKQAEMFRIYFETMSTQIEPVMRECGQKVMEINREMADLFSNSRDDYQAWYESAVNQTKEQFTTAAETAKPTKKAA